MDILPLNQALPARLTAGDALAIQVQTALPPTSVLFLVLTGVVNRVLTRYRIGGDGSAVTLNGVTTYQGEAPDADGVVAFTAASADTSAWSPGRYAWVALAIDEAGNRTQLAIGEIRIAADPNGAAILDTRTYNQRMLDQIRCVMEGALSDDVQMYKIGTRELTKIPRKDLLQLEGVFEARVRAELRRRGARVPSRNIGIAFGGL